MDKTRIIVRVCRCDYWTHRELGYSHQMEIVVGSNIDGEMAVAVFLFVQ